MLLYQGCTITKSSHLPIRYFLALLWAHPIFHVSKIRVKAPPGTTSSSITTHTSSGQRNCASWASQPQKSVTRLPCPGGRTTKSTKDMWWHWTKNIAKNTFLTTLSSSLIVSCLSMADFVFKMRHKSFYNTGWHKKKRELLKNPTKIEEIQQKKILLTETEPLQLAF